MGKTRLQIDPSLEELRAYQANPTSLLGSSLAQTLAAQENLFVEYANHLGITPEQLLPDVRKVAQVGVSHSTYFYKGEAFLVLSSPKLESTPTGFTITFQYQRLWEKTNE